MGQRTTINYPGWNLQTVQTVIRPFSNDSLLILFLRTVAEEPTDWTCY